MNSVDYVLGFAFSECRTKVLLVEKTRGPSVNIGKLNGIGGKIESDETPNQAMHREGTEEAELDVSWNLFGEYDVGECKIWLYNTFVPLDVLNSVPSVSDVGENQFVYSVKELFIHTLAQNVLTMIYHSLYGQGGLKIYTWDTPIGK